MAAKAKAPAAGEEDDDSSEEEEDEAMDAEDTENVPVANGKKRKADVEPEEAPAKTAPKPDAGACKQPRNQSPIDPAVLLVLIAVHCFVILLVQSSGVSGQLELCTRPTVQISSSYDEKIPKRLSRNHCVGMISLSY